MSEFSPSSFALFAPPRFKSPLPGSYSGMRIRYRSA
jgi:hypothetical protein